MEEIFMISRHLKIYLRDKGTVISSFVAIFVIIALYVLFLGNYLESVISSTIGKQTGNFLFVNSWVLSGIVVVSSVTISLGLFGVKVQDEESEILTSFLVTPISKFKIVVSYIIAAWIISGIVITIVFFLWWLLMRLLGYELLTLTQVPKLILYISLNILSSTSLTFLLVNFVKSVAAFSSVSTIVGTLTGFLAGIYLPIGALPQFVQVIMKLFPPTYGVAQIRSILTEKPLAAITQGDSSARIDNLKLSMGIQVDWLGYTLTNNQIIFILLLATVVFTLVAILQFREK